MLVYRSVFLSLTLSLSICVYVYMYVCPPARPLFPWRLVPLGPTPSAECYYLFGRRAFSTVHKLSCRLQRVAQRLHLSAGSLAHDLAGSLSNLPPPPPPLPANRAEAPQGQLTASIIYIVAELIFIMFPLLSEEEISPGIYLHTNL